MVVYQGAVPQGYSLQRFRETGRTSKIIKGKEVLAKDSLKKIKQDSKKQTKKSKIGFLDTKVLQKPTAKITPISAERIISKGNQKLVREGRTDFFNSEMMEETKWLS